MAGRLTLRTSHHPDVPPRESELPIYLDHGPPEPTESLPRDFLALIAESVTLTIQSTCEQLARGLAVTFSQRERVDANIADLQRLLDDRAAILAAHDGRGTLPRSVLERHGWLAVHEARLNARDAPAWWSSGQAAAMARAGDRGAAWLESQGITDDGAVPVV